MHATHPRAHAAAHPNKIAYRMAGSGEAITYGELEHRANQGAHLLRSLGLKAGDHIAFIMENSIAFMELCWAAQRTGIYHTAISRYLTPDEIAYIVRDCGARALIVTPQTAEQAAPLAGQPGLSLFMARGARPGFRDFDAERAAMPQTPIADEVTGYDMLYSSGTTGRPKGVKKPFLGEPIEKLPPLMKVLCQDMCGMGEDTVYLSPAPLYHAAPLRFNMIVAALGGTSIIMEKFDPEAFLRLVEAHRVTHAQLVPTMFVRMLKLPDAVRTRYDMGSLRAAVHAAAPCPADVKQAMIDWWGPILLEYYAGTEGNGVTVINSTEWLGHRGSVGRPFVGTIRILGEDGAALPAGEIGAVYFAGGPAFAYHNDTAKTAGAHNDQGWSTLGDIGFLDAEGYLYLTDRKAYMIISGGVNIYPQETEDVLILHPAVADVAVFGIPNAEMGEEVKAAVQPRDMAEAGPELAEKLIAFCRSRLSALKCPRSIDFLAELPRTPTGKLVKRHLRDQYLAATR
ncbi:acyl-CoA synthetase [Phreatobacter sp.]|uniref:acyl-CoA synthetase n=1 Tax=Phreatobacter sp. TaxID=1966341 RepID=UPI0022C95904|nr:acyl-CoA synthetase [Phreatobacter sp.]MCZ8316813.1 acyl-CoA synthetase [Phreatobacter sp.]